MDTRDVIKSQKEKSRECIWWDVVVGVDNRQKIKKDRSCYFPTLGEMETSTPMEHVDNQLIVI